MLEWKKKRKAMHHYDQTALVYDSLYLEEQEAKIKAAMYDLPFGEDRVVLDIGCGTGLLFKHVAEKSKFTWGADISRGILKEAQKKAKSYGNVALIQADADNMPFANNVFDCVFVITLLQNTPNPAATLNEIKRVCNSDATIVATGLKKVFTREKFVKMLKKADLNVINLKLDEEMREYVSICTKMRVARAL